MKLKMSVISLVISISILLSGVNIYAAESLPFANGYYEIDSAEDFELITDLSAKYKIVKDIELNNPKSIGSIGAPFTGELVGALDGDFKMKPTITINSTDNFGGLVSYFKDGTIKNIIIDGNITGTNNVVGAFIGIAKSGKIIGCINKADITSEYKGTKAATIGGIIGDTDSPTKLVITDCENYGNITLTTSLKGSIGGIAGRLSLSNANSYIKDCKNDGNIETTLKYAGGIAGEIITSADVSLCSNEGSVSTKGKNTYSGGIAGFLNGSVSKSFNGGEINSENISGGIAGLIKTDNKSNVSCCYNFGNVKAGAGIIGHVTGKNKTSISSSYNAGEVNYAISPATNAVFENNYCLSDEKSKVKGITSVNDEQLNNLDYLIGFSNELWTVDSEADYRYPQLSEHKFGTLEFEYPKIKNGTLYFEAEDGIMLPNELTLIGDKNASGNNYVKFLVSHASDIDRYNIQIPEPAITFTYQTDERKDISIWIRAYSPNSSTDNMYYATDGNYKLVSFTPQEGFAWGKVDKIVLEPGIHTVDIFPRDFTGVDKILVTDQPSFMPTGLGGSPDDEPVQFIIHDGPDFKPIAGHPRVYITKDRISEIKKNLTAAQNREVYKKYLEYLADTTDGNLPDAPSGSNNYDGKILEIVEARAFDYVLTGNEESGRSAISAMINFFSTVSTDATLYWGYYSYAGEMIHKLGIVYDWCYPLLTKKEKDYLHKTFIGLAQGTELGWPPDDQPLFTGHGSETQLFRDMMAAGIAMYDEFPYIYNNVAGRFFDEAVKFRQEFTSKAGVHPEGAYYFTIRYGSEMGAVLLFDALGLPNVFNEGHGDAPYWLIYARRPDGTYLRSGDTMFDSYAIGTFFSSHYEPIFLAANYYNDPYLKNEAMRNNIDLAQDPAHLNQNLSIVEHLIFNNPELEGRSLKELPLTRYFPSPHGGYLARTSWDDGLDSPAVVAEMKVSEHLIYGHAHQDAGSFQIYYKGNLAIDTGYYATNVGTGNNFDNTGRTYSGSVHYFNYNRRSIAHNVMLVYDPSENFGGINNITFANDGGQRFYFDSYFDSYDHFMENYETNWKTGETLAHEHGPDPMEPDYTYLKGDISYAYSNKIEGYERSFMFLNLKNEDVPAAMLVYDRVESSNPTFKKTWLLHGREEPVINGTHTTMSDTDHGHNGKLTLDTLLPENPSIEKIGGPGKDFYYNGVNWHGLPSQNGSNESTDGWRLEVSPSTPANEDLFLNVMQVSDADSTKPALEVTRIDSDTHVGATIADRLVMFGIERDRVTSDVSFAFDKEGTYKITVADLEKGTWEVLKDGTKLCDAVVTEDGGIAYFEGEKGNYTLKRISETGTREEIVVEEKQINDVYFIRANEYQYSDIFIENGLSIVDCKDLADIIHVDIIDEGDDYYTLKGYGKTLTLREGSYIAEGSPNVTLDYAPKKADGKFYVPLRAVASYFYYEIIYHEYPRAITATSKASLPQEGYLSIIDCSWVSNLTTSNGYDSYDNIISTGWATAAAAGTGNCEIVYDFGSPQMVAGFDAAFSRSNARSFKFDILVSEDGVNWMNVMTDASTPLTEDVNPYVSFSFDSPVKARYVKYLGKGNTGNNANNILEIKFKEAK